MNDKKGNPAMGIVFAAIAFLFALAEYESGAIKTPWVLVFCGAMLLFCVGVGISRIEGK